MATIGQRKWSFASGEYGAIEGDFNFKLNSFPSYGQEIVAGLFGYTAGSNQYCEMSMQWMMSPPGGSPGPGVVVLFFGATSATGDGLNSYAWSVPNGYGANNLLFYRRFSFDINKAYRLKLQVDFDAGAERQYSAWIVDLSSGAATQVCTLRAPIATGNITNTGGQYHDVRNTIS